MFAFKTDSPKAITNLFSVFVFLFFLSVVWSVSLFAVKLYLLISFVSVNEPLPRTDDFKTLPSTFLSMQTVFELDLITRANQGCHAMQIFLVRQTWHIRCPY